MSFGIFVPAQAYLSRQICHHSQRPVRFAIVSFATPNSKSAKVNLVGSVVHQLSSRAKNRNILLRI
jgi:hypothetical protein